MKRKIKTGILSCLIAVSASMSLSACDVEILSAVNDILKTQLAELKSEFGSTSKQGSEVEFDEEKDAPKDPPKKKDGKKVEKPVKDTSAEDINLEGCWTFTETGKVKGVNIKYTETVTFNYSSKKEFSFKGNNLFESADDGTVIRDNKFSGTGVVKGNTGDLTYDQDGSKQLFVYDVDEVSIVATTDRSDGKVFLYERCE